MPSIDAHRKGGEGVGKEGQWLVNGCYAVFCAAAAAVAAAAAGGGGGVAASYHILRV